MSSATKRWASLELQSHSWTLAPLLDELPSTSTQLPVSPDILGSFKTYVAPLLSASDVSPRISDSSALGTVQPATATSTAAAKTLLVMQNSLVDRRVYPRALLVQEPENGSFPPSDSLRNSNFIPFCYFSSSSYCRTRRRVDRNRFCNG